MVLEGLEIFRKFENKAYIALAYDIMGDITRSQGDYKAAEKNYQTSLALSKETGERIREATLHANLGVVAFHLANYETAYRRAKKGLSLSMELPSQYGMAHHLALIAGPAALLGFPNRAARILGAADAALNKWGGDQKPATQLEVELYINSTQSALSEKAFQESWQEGRRMTIQAAATYALIDEEVNG